MRKSLSVLLAVAMVFSMFAGVALAEEQSAIDRLDVAGIIIGGSDGDTMDDRNWKREDVAVLLSRLYGEEENVKDNPQTHNFADVNNPDYHGVISWVSSTDPVLMQGRNETTFGHGDFVTAQEFATVILRALDIDHEWEEAVAVAVDKGIFAEEYDNRLELTRGQTWGPIVNALDTALPSGEALGTKLGLVGWEVEVADVSVDVVAANQIKVSFSTAVDSDDVEIEVKRGNSIQDYTAEWADDNRSVVLESTQAVFRAGNYTVSVNDEDFSFEIEAQKLVSFTIATEYLTAVDDQKIKIAPLDQYGNEFERGQYTIVAQNGSNGQTLANTTFGGTEYRLTANLTGDTVGSTAAQGKKDDVVVVTIVNTATGMSQTKTYTVLAAAYVDTVVLSQPEPKDDQARVQVDEDDYVLPAKFINQYGEEMDSTLTGIVVTSTNVNTVAVPLRVHDDGFEFDTGTQAGNVTITVVPAQSGKSSTITFEVFSKAQIDSISLDYPDDLVVEGEEIEIPYTATDNFGDDYKLQAGDVTWVSSNPSIIDNSDVVVDDGKIKITPKDTGTFTFTPLIATKGLQGGISLEALEAAYVDRIAKLNDWTITTLANNEGYSQINEYDVVLYDQHGRPVDRDDAQRAHIKVVFNGDSTGVVTIGADNQQFTAVAGETGTQNMTVEYYDSATMDEKITFNFTATVIEESEVVDYEKDDLRSTLLYSNTTMATAKTKEVEVKIKNGLTEDGTKVGLSNADKADFTLVTSNSTHVAVDNSTKTVYSLSGEGGKGATVTIWKKGKQIDSYEFTTSADGSYLDSFTFDDDLSIAKGDTEDATANLDELKDQYNTDYTGAIEGTWQSSNNAVATVNATTGLITAVDEGEATITFITRNGASGSFKVTVN